MPDPNKHTFIVAKLDPTMAHLYLVECCCGWQGRCQTEEDVRKLEENHIKAHQRTIF